MHSRRYEERMTGEGFPVQRGGMSSAPFDVLGDALRGTKGLMLDMYRRPQTVLRAVEMLLPLMVERGVASAGRAGGRFVHIPLHKGLDGFMSPEQFKKFFWPTLRELVAGLVNEGLTPYLFWEGDCTSRLGLINDVPAGKALYRFESTDIAKAKDALRDRVCIRGNVPISILATGTPRRRKGLLQEAYRLCRGGWRPDRRCGCQRHGRETGESARHVRVYQRVRDLLMIL